MLRCLSLAACAILIASCASAPEASEPVASYGDSTQLIVARVGASLALVVPSNPTTGFQWQHVILEDTGVVSLNGTHARPAPSGLLGSSGTEELRISARKTGLAKVQSTYARAGDKDPTPARALTWTILIQP
jgi:predicted secreted protein